MQACNPPTPKPQKAAGKYVARGLSFRDAEFLELEAPLTERQAVLYDACAELWQVRGHNRGRSWAQERQL